MCRTPRPALLTLKPKTSQGRQIMRQITTAIITIIAALIGCAGTIIAALIMSGQFSKPQNANPTAGPTSNELCLCATNTSNTCFAGTIKKGKAIPAGSLVQIPSEGTVYLYTQSSEAKGDGNLFAYATASFSCLNTQIRLFAPIKQLYCNDVLAANTSGCIG